MCKIKSGHTGRGQHGQTFRQLDASLLLDPEQLPHGDLLAVVGLDGVAWGRTDTRVFDLQQILVLQILRTKDNKNFEWVIIS